MSKEERKEAESNYSDVDVYANEEFIGELTFPDNNPKVIDIINGNHRLTYKLVSDIELEPGKHYLIPITDE